MEKLKFNELSLSEETQRALADMGFEFASPIQEQAIPFLLAGRDLIGQAKTGTGKTAAFGIPAAEMLDANKKEVQTLVLCPTRELAMQVSEELGKIIKYHKKARVTAIYGGASIDRQIQELRRGVHIVVGTPGRIMDHLDRGTLHLENVTQVILDEADEMLDMGFRDDIEAILKAVPDQRQTVFFSATMSKPILQLTKKYQKDPHIIKVATEELTVTTIDQKFFAIKEKDKTEVMERLIDLYEPKLCLAFCNTKRKVDELVSDLQTGGFFAEALHGDMRQAQRTQVMNKFRQGVIQILVATDVAARGIDVEDVEMVINFDVPLDSEYYVHRIGRTGRAGRSGRAFSLVTRRELGNLKDIERYAKTRILEEKVPSAKDIESKKKLKFLEKIKGTIQGGELSKYTKWVEELSTEGFSELDIAAALIKMEVHHQISEMEKQEIQSESFYEAPRSGGGRSEGGRDGGRDGGRSSEKRGPGAPKRGGGGSAGRNSRLFITLGKKDNISPRDIVGAIAGETGLAGKMIGNIDIYDKFTFVDVPEEFAEDVIKRMKKSQIRGNKFKIEIAEQKK